MNRTVGSIWYGFVGFVLEKLSDKRSENLLAAHASFLKEFFFFTSLCYPKDPLLPSLCYPKDVQKLR